MKIIHREKFRLVIYKGLVKCKRHFEDITEEVISEKEEF